MATKQVLGLASVFQKHVSHPRTAETMVELGTKSCRLLTQIYKIT